MRAVVDKAVFLAAMALACSGISAEAGKSLGVSQYHQNVQPLLTTYCYDCHADGANKGGISFDELKTDDALLNHDLWLKVIKNLRSNLMPPEKKARPSPEEMRRIEDWIKYQAFGIDPKNPDPGRVTIRRLNRAEYRNTVRDLLGVEYKTELEFPADDTGYGFDNIGAVLTISPMLLEKYLDAAQAIVAKAVPVVSGVVPEKTIAGRNFHPPGPTTNLDSAGKGPMGAVLSYREAATVQAGFAAAHEGKYQLLVDLSANERYVDNQFDYNKCRLIFKVDGQELINREFVREGGKPFHFEFPQDWKEGNHEMSFEVQPLTPKEPSIRALTIRVDSVTVRGPLDPKYWVRPAHYERFFPKDVPAGLVARRAYAHELLDAFATKAFRRPVDAKTIDRLTGLAESVFAQPKETFEAGVAHAMVAVLASPRFLFREEEAAADARSKSAPLVDEFSLASRLSYFLWSSMPDPELFTLARAGNLRKNLEAQVNRMLTDPRAEAFMQNFTGQWLQARDIEGVPIDARSVLAREEKSNPELARTRARFRELSAKAEEELTQAEKDELAKMRPGLFRGFRQIRTDLDADLRQAMESEVAMYFGYVVRENRNVTELIDSDYTFLNERLAKHYGLTNLDVTGTTLRKVTLPPGCPRGGVLTMGGVLAVTSNPTRTSPVKRGLFVLENIIGNPAPPPPPDIPPLEDSEKIGANGEPSLREVLAIHRSQPLCSSCHKRLDPPGLALENFNAMGMWREKEHDQPVDPAGKLITGEPFQNVQEFKHVLATDHRRDFYRTLTEKVLTYALGRGLEYYDVETVDQIVDRLEHNDGKFSALLTGVIGSSPFQKCRESAIVTKAKATP